MLVFVEGMLLLGCIWVYELFHIGSDGSADRIKLDFFSKGTREDASGTSNRLV
jgi:hypothetical protein